MRPETWWTTFVYGYPVSNVTIETRINPAAIDNKIITTYWDHPKRALRSFVFGNKQVWCRRITTYNGSIGDVDAQGQEIRELKDR
jgi:hypothetical protein